MTNSARLVKADDLIRGSGSAGKIFQRRFVDIDELASQIPERNVQLTQLSLQPLQGKTVVLEFETIRFGFNRLNCAIKAVGDKTPGFLSFICMPQGISRPVVSHGLEITASYLYGFDPNRGIDMVFPGNTTHCSIHIRSELFFACAEALDRPDLNARFFASNALFLPEGLSPLCGYLNQLHHLLQRQSPLLRQPQFQQILLQDFLPLLVTSLPVQADQLKSPKPWHRVQLVKQAEDYMRAHLHQPLTLTDLSDALGTSSRTLSYGFQEIFGMSPIAYLKTLRLHSVYRTLKAADISSQTIESIANQFGFWSLGHFSRDYKQMFGELPSETYRR